MVSSLNPNYALGISGINTWSPPETVKLYVGGNVLINGKASASQFIPTSDERLKTDIRPLTNNEKENLYLLEGKFYTKIAQIEDNTNLVEDIVDVVDNDTNPCCTLQVRTIPERQKQIIEFQEYGYLAQELIEIFPDLVSEDAEGYYGVNYIGLIPIIVEVMKDQKDTIETQQERIDQQQTEIGILQQIALEQELNLTELRDRVEVLENMVITQNNNINILQDIILNCCPGTDIILQLIDTSFAINNNNQNKIQQEPVLYQNTPNPFSTNTEISCNISTSFNRAFIYVYNLQGVELMSFPNYTDRI